MPESCSETAGGKDGKLAGYHLGIDRKQKLIKIENS
ncbi:MAG: MGMT family protein [Acidobacteria bacterium]|nr:MGMT family protein [Acidobacteriota bacterium]